MEPHEQKSLVSWIWKQLPERYLQQRWAYCWKSVGVLVGDDNHVDCLQKSLSSLVEVYGSDLLTNRSDLTDDEQLKDLALVFFADAKTERSRELLESWGSQPGPLDMQTFQDHVV